MSEDLETEEDVDLEEDLLEDPDEELLEDLEDLDNLAPEMDDDDLEDDFDDDDDDEEDTVAKPASSKEDDEDDDEDDEDELEADLDAILRDRIASTDDDDDDEDGAKSISKPVVTTGGFPCPSCFLQINRSIAELEKDPYCPNCGDYVEVSALLVKS